MTASGPPRGRPATKLDVLYIAPRGRAGRRPGEFSGPGRYRRRSGAENPLAHEGVREVKRLREHVTRDPWTVLGRADRGPAPRSRPVRARRGGGVLPRLAGRAEPGPPADRG
jgi:hypothetical protein